MKHIVMSIKPQYCEKIISGKKTIEVRKTAPKEVPFKVYMYCTRPSIRHRYSVGSLIFNNDELYRHPKIGIEYGDSISLMACDPDSYDKDNFLNGKVIGEFICDKVDIISVYNEVVYSTGNLFADKLKNMCLTVDELKAYLANNSGYALGISDLKIYDEPKELGEFRKPCGDCLGKCTGEHYNRCAWQTVTRPPQSWCYVENGEIARR